ncbi:PorV/PorQ family protein [Aureispira anguillae]|uniref:Long-chain fatty acid transport protein n=1 Tax=Aureispira anguillae TaxID=2864201 RepID=A0A915YDJ4_9BACT|nr:hypothetical protein [Aureispira anguillae]BDS11073.1 hypothetical protein AsAng_0017840 [Aureispira anguillae]
MKNILTYCLILLSSLLQAQDTHYWTNQFGARASLLGGAVIAGLDDNSSVYYNPANLAFIKQSTVSLNTSVYKYTDMYIGNGAGTQIDLTSQRISLYQQMISGLLTKNPEKRWRLGFNILTRQHVNIDMTQRHEALYEINPNQAGKEHYIGSIELRNNLNETWGCLGLGYKINAHFSVGLTAIVTYRSQKHTFAYTARSISIDSTTHTGNYIPLDIATNSFYVHTRTNLVGGLLKAGFHARFGKWRFGLNISSPSITIWGESRVQREVNQTNLPGNIDKVQTGEQTQLKSQYKYPFSIGLGAAFLYKTGLFSFSAEYFSSIKQYKMIESDPNQPTFPAFLSKPGLDLFTVYLGANQVLNGAIGWEQQLVKKIKLHLGVRSDFSYARRSDRIRAGDLTIISAPIDLWHFAAGISWRRKASLMSIGVNYTYGHRDKGFSQLINFTDPLIQSPLFLVGQRDDSAFINYHAATLLIGYTYYFALK